MKKANLPAETKSRNVAGFEDGETKLHTQLSLPAEASSDEWLTLGVQAFNRSGLEMARAGYCFKQLKASCGHGNYEPLLERAGVSDDHAGRAVQLADFLEGLSPSDRSRMIAIPYTKALAVSKADSSVLRELLDSGKLDGDEPLSVRDLQRALAKEKAKNLSLETRVETVTAERDRVKGMALHRLQRADMPEFCVVAREESTALTEQIDAALDGLTSLLNDNLLASHTEVAEADRYAATAAGTYYHSLKAVWARAGYLLQQIDEHFGEPATGMARFEHQLKLAEVDAFKHAREQIIGRLKTQASNREALRENSKEGKKGRKRTVKDEG